MSEPAFPEAISAVEKWLDDEGSAFAKRTPPSYAGGNPAWLVDISGLGYQIGTLHVVLGSLFPAIPCELYVDKKFCLVLPHIEEDGRVCLGEMPRPGDFQDPVGAVRRAIEKFRSELLEPSANTVWRQTQLHSERLSYWGRFCSSYRGSALSHLSPVRTYLYFDNSKLWSEGKIAAFIPKGAQQRRFNTQVVSCESIDPNELAHRHKWANGTLVKGNVAFFRISDEFEWTPSTWPKNFLELEALVSSISEKEHSIISWLQRLGWDDEIGDAEDLKRKKVPLGSAPLMVIIVQGTVQFGYQIYPPTVSLVTPPNIVPIELQRVDPSWALTRDYGATVFSERRAKRVLVLGCGSLGGLVIEALARSGVGNLDIVDSEVFDSPNVSRHILGLKEIRASKASAIAQRIREAVPGIVISGYQDDARTWVTKNCTQHSYDLVVDCTAEFSVRILLARLRATIFGACPVIHTWVEPYCAAAHVIATTIDDPWPNEDPADTAVNVADYSEAKTIVNLPACSDGFHPYGVADIMQAAGFASERIISVLDNELKESIVWSWIRCQAFFDALSVRINTREIVPKSGTPQDAVQITRSLASILSSNDE